MKYFAALLAVGCAAAAGAHPFSLSEAVVDVYPTHADARVAIMLEDLYLYQGLPVSDDGYVAADVLLEAAHRHTDFLRAGFRLRDGHGNAYPSEVTDVRLDYEAPEEGFHVAYLMAYTVTYTMRFDFAAPPAHLVLLQIFGGRDALMPANMAVQLWRRGEPLGVSTTLVHSEPFAVPIDWSRPPFPLGANEEAQNAWLAADHTRTLGIRNPMAPHSFVTVAPGRVRHELLLPLYDVAWWTELELADPTRITLAEQQAAAAEVRALFAEEPTLIVDGSAVEPAAIAVAMHGLDTHDFGRPAHARALPADVARVAASLDYRVPAEATDVQVRWDLFAYRTPALMTSVLRGAAPPLMHWFTRRDTRLRIEMPRTKDADTLPPLGAQAALRARLTALYGAGDTLPPNAEGAVLQRDALVPAHGAQRGELVSIAALHVEAIAMDAPRYRATWSAEFRAAHWGHEHRWHVRRTATFEHLTNGAVAMLTPETRTLEVAPPRPLLPPPTVGGG